MALVDLEEFRDVLGVDDVYPDALLEQAIDAATNVILGYLTFNKTAITAASVTDNVAKIYVTYPATFRAGQTVTVAGCGHPWDGDRVITAVGVDFYTFDRTHDDTAITDFYPRGQATLTSQAALYDTTPEVREAALTLAVEIWLNRSTPGGTMQAIDYTPAPFRLGRSLISKVSGLLGRHLDPRQMVG